jgi:hypothetical protein
VPKITFSYNIPPPTKIHTSMSQAKLPPLPPRSKSNSKLKEYLLSSKNTDKLCVPRGSEKQKITSSDKERNY